MPDKAKQTHLPGQEPVKIASVHRAIELYVEAKDSRMAAGRIEVERKASLLQVMKNEAISRYNVDGHEAHLETGDTTVKASLKEREPGDE